MNNKFKIVFNKKTGNFVVILDKAKNRVIGERSERDYIFDLQGNLLEKRSAYSIGLQKTALSFAFLFSTTSLISQASLAVTYDGTLAQSKSSTDVGGNFNQVIGSDTAKGMVELSNSEPVVVDYAPTALANNFILAGYSTIATSSQVNGNVITLDKGSQIGDIYAGLLHSTKKSPSVNCVTNPESGCSGKSFLSTQNNKSLSTSNNTVSISDKNVVNVTGTINSGSTQFVIDNGNVVNGIYANATVTQMEFINANTMQTNTNKVLVNGDQHQTKNVNIGNNNISVILGDVTGGTSVDPGNAKAYINAQSNVRTNKLYTNKNEMSVSGSNNKFLDINAGANTILIESGNLKAGTSESTNTNINAVSAASNVFASNYVISSVLDSNENKLTITGNDNKADNIKVGHNTISVHNGNMIANTSNSHGSIASFVEYFSNLEKNKLNANYNSVEITGDNNVLKDVVAGYSTFDIKAGNAIGSESTSTSTLQTSDRSHAISTVNVSGNTLVQKNNIITVQGNNNKINNLMSGYADFNLSVGDTIGGKYIIDGDTNISNAQLRINASGLNIYSTDNKINLSGTSKIDGSINTGYINFNIDYGVVKQSDGTLITPTIDRNSAPNTANSYIDLRQTNANATKNTIKIEGSHTFTNPNSTIYGGYLNYKDSETKPVSFDVFTGNTLIYANTTPISIKEVANFQTYDFTIRPDLANSPTPLITAETIVLGSHASNMSTPQSNLKSDISVSYISAGPVVKNHSEFILMNATKDLIGNGQGSTTRGVAQQGVSLVYDVDTFIRNNQVIALVEGGPDDVGPETNPQLKSLLEGNLSGLMLLTRNADNIADNMRKAIGEQNNKRGLVPFMILNGNRTHYNTGSYIKSNGGSVTTGVSYQNSQLTGGLFMENGWDSYKTFNDFEDVKNVHGRGHNRFNGFGAYGHYDFKNNWYLDGSVRGGKLKTNYVSDDIIHSDTKQRAEYEISGNYYSVHLTGGYGYKWNENNDLDVNLKYLWSGTEGHDIEIAGEQVEFNKLNSHRIRLSGENNYQWNKDIQLLAGLGYEYELDGTAKGTALGTYDIAEPSVKGSTGIATLGVRYDPEMFKNFSMDLKASGYFGKREGGSALLHLKYAF